MDFSYILEKNNEQLSVFLGYNYNSEIKEINLEDTTSIIITGSTGTSKSVLLNQILLQLINKNNSNELKILAISPTKVELTLYEDTKYLLSKVINDKDTAVNSILDIIESRKKTLIDSKLLTFKKYNEQNEKKLPFIVIAIDEATDILNAVIGSDVLGKIIRDIRNLGIALIMDTNNIYNEFFENNENENADCRISFDYTSKEDSKMNNIEKSQELEYYEFAIKLNNEKRPDVYRSFYFKEEDAISIIKNCK